MYILSIIAVIAVIILSGWYNQGLWGYLIDTPSFLLILILWIPIYRIDPASDHLWDHKNRSVSDRSYHLNRSACIFCNRLRNYRCDHNEI